MRSQDLGSYQTVNQIYTRYLGNDTNNWYLEDYPWMPFGEVELGYLTGLRGPESPVRLPVLSVESDTLERTLPCVDYDGLVQITRRAIEYPRVVESDVPEHYPLSVHPVWHCMGLGGNLEVDSPKDEKEEIVTKSSYFGNSLKF